MKRIVELLCASLLRQAIAHGASVTAEQALAIARNLATALFADAECPACAGPISYRGDYGIVCDECGRAAFQFSSVQNKQPIDRS